MRKLITGLILATTTFPVFAFTTTAVAPLPEPGALWLLGIGAVAGLLVKAKNRNNKKKRYSNRHAAHARNVLNEKNPLARRYGLQKKNKNPS